MADELTSYSAGTAEWEVALDVSAINAGIVPVDLPIEPFSFLPYVQIGYTFVDGAGVPTVPGAGTITFNVKTVANRDYAEDIIDGTDIDATSTPKNLYFNGAADIIEVSGVGITTATSVIVRIIANRC